MKDLYNPQYKERFLTSIGITKATQNSYRHVLSKAIKWERRLGKDLSEFNTDEYDKVLSELKAKSKNSIQYQHSILVNYIAFAIQNGFSNGQEINYASFFTPDKVEKYIDNVWTSNEIITKKELDEIIDDCINMQDVAPIVIIFHCGSGNDLEIVRNLKFADIDRKKGHMKIININNEEVEIPIEDKYIEVLEDAFLETEYLKSNGNIDSTSKVKSKTVSLVESEYILKPATRKSSTDVRMSAQGIRLRIQRVKEYVENQYITPTSIMISGMVEYTKHYMIKNNKTIDELTMYDYIDIIKRFNIKENNWHTNKLRIERYLKG